ncbi:MAG: hypothetical protein M3Y08_18885 [Fibrobacterota bacterium]|nr:hypothetical protein [Fibrobacterota bacterium]
MIKRHSDEDLTRNHFDWSFGDNRERIAPAFTTLRQMLQRELPDAKGLAETAIITLLNEIEFELLQHRVQVDFLDTLPARVAYRGILQLMDSPLKVDASSYKITHIDGCDSACESCFQLAHCSVAREILGNEWRVAVEQAGINPSWSALFASEDDD